MLIYVNTSVGMVMGAVRVLIELEDCLYEFVRVNVKNWRTNICCLLARAKVVPSSSNMTTTCQPCSSCYHPWTL